MVEALAVAAVVAAAVAVSHDHREVAVECRGHLAAVRLVRLAGCPELPDLHPDLQSAVPPHSIVPVAERLARPVRQRAPVWEPGAGHDLQFSQEPDLALVPDQE